jgi:hypothetical protein
MMKRSLVTFACVGILMIVACNTDEAVAPMEKPGGLTIRLRSPHLEYIPCGSRVFLAWDYVDGGDVIPLHNPKVNLRVEYRIGNQCVLVQSLVEGERTNSCMWSVADVECDMALLYFTLKGGRGKPVESIYYLGPVRVPRTHGESDRTVRP